MNNSRQYGFIHYREAWYGYGHGQYSEPAPGASDQIAIGFVEAESLAGEVSLVWYVQGNQSVPQLECFNNTWEALATLPGLITLLSNLNDVNIEPEHFCQLLSARGYLDLTPRTNPYVVRFRLTETMPGEGGEIEQVAEIDALPVWLIPLREVLYAPDFLQLTIARDDSRTRIERIRTEKTE